MSDFKSTGIITSSFITENAGVNLCDNKNVNYKFTPTTAQNSCCNFTFADFTNYSPGQQFRVDCDIEGSGFEATTTTGTFGLGFQGSCYVVADANGQGVGNSGVNGFNSGSATITSILTGATSGSKHLSNVFSLNSSFPATYSKQNIGLRSDYSNGTGGIRVSNIVVTPLKYYGPTVGSDGVSGSNIIEY